MKNTYSIALFDWDDHFVETMRVWAESANAQILHFSNPNAFESFLATDNPCPSLVVVDVDTFRLDESSSLGKMLGERAAEVPHVFLTQSTELIRFHLTPHIAQFVCLPKQNFVLYFDGLVKQWRGEFHTDEFETIPPSGKTEKTEAIKTLPCQGFSLDTVDDSLMLQRAMTISEMTRSASAEIDNMNQVIMSAMEHITALESPPSNQIRDVLNDLEWVYKNMSTFAQTVKDLHHRHPKHSKRVDLKRMMSHMIELLEKTGRTKHIGIEAKLGLEPVWVQMQPLHLEQILLNLLCASIDSVIEAQATFRRVNLKLARDHHKERALITMEDFAGSWHHDKIQGAVAGDDTSLFGRSIQLTKNLVDHHGGVLQLENSPRGTLIRLELPLDGAFEVTSPNHYKVDLDGMNAMDAMDATDATDMTEVVDESIPLDKGPPKLMVSQFEAVDTLDIPISHQEVMEILRGDGRTLKSPKPQSQWKTTKQGL